MPQRIDELPLYAGDGRPDRADFCPPNGVHRDDGGRLRQAVALAYVDAEFLDEVLLDLERERRAAADDEAQALHVVGRRELRQEAADGRDDVEVIHLLLADDGDRFLWREAVEDDDLCA